MSVTTTIRGDASDPRRGMTVAEIEDFIAHARSAGHGDDVQVRVTTGWRAQITRLETR